MRLREKLRRSLTEADHDGEDGRSPSNGFKPWRQTSRLLTGNKHDPDTVHDENGV
jgi:hypothetical protein